ncbi:MAG TPA: AMP-binding protein [Thermoanaerobaculaceae bacterium]|nr:AMP-binding protein [Thermoanaerobaculaceae bacterium]HRS14826.1 AMP-binding protein [Thermoanaerobaculaceae bacterium]
MLPDPPTLVDLLARAARRPDAGIRLLDREERATWLAWPEIAARAAEVAGGLQARGVAPGQRVALVFPTSAEFLFAYFGVTLAGAVPVPLYPPARLGRLDEYHRRTVAMLRAAGARLVLADGRVKRLLGPSVLGARPPLGCCRLDELPAAAAHPVAVHPDDLGLVQYSSGTTVEPKPVALSHRALVAQVQTLNALWPDRETVEPSGVSWLPLYHDMGLVGCVLAALEHPGTLTLLQPLDFIARPALWLRAISRYQATISAAPSFAYALCTQHIRDEEMEGVDLGSWRVAINGAEAVVPDVVRAFAARFARWGFEAEAMTPAYGLAEAALAVTCCTIGRPLATLVLDRTALVEGCAEPAACGREVASVGRALPGFDVAVVDADRTPLAEDLIGRVLVRGPSLMREYLDQPEATARVLAGGWLDTGDRGFLHDGELYLVGRDKDVLIVNGRNYAPEEVERAVESVPGTREHCTVAVSAAADGAASEEVLVLVELAPGASEDDAALLPERAAAAVLAATGLALAAVVVLAPGTLPRTSSGKLRRQETLRQHLAGELTAPRKVTPALLAGAVVRSTLAYLDLKLRPRRDDG